MALRHQLASVLLIGGAFAATTAVTGCMHHHYYAETAEGSEGTWSSAESPYYVRWERETRREHREWTERAADEQHEYWEWRRHHHDNDGQ
jgi:hypothetical protein